ncbi:MAG: radical SAM protein [Candidatus Gastranaerophilales bacterium]|nr:radical SAM protein [Candidatus Gastranaerophilales bacterium]
MTKNNMPHDKIKRFIDCHVPVTTCNLRCHYCYITLKGKFAEKLPVFKYSPEHIRQALSQKRLGGVCCLNFCGAGETLLPPEMTDIIRCVLEEGHYIMVVTNGTVSKRFDEIVSLPKELLSRLMFKFSFQYLELKRKKMFDKFFDNIEKIKKAGCSFSLEITPNDELIPELEELKEMCLSRVGALCHVTVARDSTKENLPILTKYSKSKYKKIWSQFDSIMFEYKLSVFNKKRREFCYAGDWTGFLNIGTGYFKQCYKGKTLQNIFENIDEPIKFCAIGNNCPEEHCYNAHVWLTYGNIPKHKSPTYAEMRDRVCTNNETWLKPNVEKFMRSKLIESNKEYSLKEKRRANKFSSQK